MGLDMYLYTNSRNVCEDVNDKDDDWEREYQIPNGIAIEWREANAIHRYFVSQVQGGRDDCGTYEVDVSELAALHDMCMEVLASSAIVGGKMEDTAKAEELLPTMGGFFSSSQEYDQNYWWDLQFTAEKLGKILDCLIPDPKNGWYTIHKDEPGWHVKFYYKSSW